MLRKTLLGLLVVVTTFCISKSYAQTSDAAEDHDLDQIEAEIKKHEVKPETPAQTKEATSADVKVERLSDLSKLQPFSEVSVMQRRYMPKGGRVQLFAGLSDMVNDPWNSTSGVNLRVAYGLTEAWGIEISDYFLGSTPSQASNNLLAQHNVNAQTFGAASGFVGGYVMWTPIYGKMSFTTQKIIPFDMYFEVGGGSTTLNGVGVPANASGVSLATGQVYSITRAVGFRWDLSLNMYSLPSGSVNNLLLTFGGNWYFPEASYR